MKRVKVLVTLDISNKYPDPEQKALDLVHEARNSMTSSFFNLFKFIDATIYEETSQVKSVIIMRGLPGAGKSSWIKANLPNATICSADDFHLDAEGVYKYEPKNAGMAHDYCLRTFLELVQSDIEHPIIVDNTNTTTAEIAPYARIASALGIPFKIVYIYCEMRLAHLRNVHGVPFTTILKMQNSLMTELIPSYWPQEIIV